MIRATIQSAIAYMSAPERVQDTLQLRMDLQAILEELPEETSERKPLRHPYEKYEFRKKIYRTPTEVWDEA